MSFSAACEAAKADCRVQSTTKMPKGDMRQSKTGSREVEEVGGGVVGGGQPPLLNRGNIKKI